MEQKIQEELFSIIFAVETDEEKEAKKQIRTSVLKRKYDILAFRLLVVTIVSTGMVVLLGIFTETDLAKENQVLDSYIRSSKDMVIYLAIFALFLIIIIKIILSFPYAKKISKKIKIKEIKIDYNKNTLVQKIIIHIFPIPQILFTVITMSTFTGLLIFALLSRKFTPEILIKDAFLLWLCNILTFALLYWLLDSVGVNFVDLNILPYKSNFFIFPEAKENPDWKPIFFDYLFLAFNFSTAFSITDTNVISRKIKALVMLQSLISLITFGVFLARAINIISV